MLARALPVDPRDRVAHPDDTVLVVSHKATLRLLLASLLGFDARGYRDRLDQSPACLNVVDFKDAVRARLMLFNDVSHYTTSRGTPSQTYRAGGTRRARARPLAPRAGVSTATRLDRAVQFVARSSPALRAASNGVSCPTRDTPSSTRPRCTYIRVVARLRHSTTQFGAELGNDR